MNNLAKVVFSKSLDEAAWRNTRLVRDDPAGEVSRMKRQSGRDILILGSGTIVSELAQHGLIDDYRIIVHPVALGAGKPLFGGLKGRLRFRLLKTKKLGTGVIILYYRPTK